MGESTGVSLAVIKLMGGNVIVGIWLSAIGKIAFRISESDKSRVDIITVIQGNDAVARQGKFFLGYCFEIAKKLHVFRGDGCNNENIRVNVATKGSHFTGVIDTKFLDNDIDVVKLAG